MRKDYRRYGGQSPAVAPLPSVPDDYEKRLKRLRRRLRLTQHDLARRIAAANKAVVYQWESRKRAPSPVFWKRVEAIGAARLDARQASVSVVSAATMPLWALHEQNGAVRQTLNERIGPVAV